MHHTVASVTKPRYGTKSLNPPTSHKGLQSALPSLHIVGSTCHPPVWQPCYPQSEETSFIQTWRQVSKKTKKPKPTGVLKQRPQLFWVQTFSPRLHTFDIKHMDHRIKFQSLFRYARSIPYILKVIKHCITSASLFCYTVNLCPLPLSSSTYPQAFQCESFQVYWLYLERTNPRAMISKDIIKECKNRQYH